MVIKRLLLILICVIIGLPLSVLAIFFYFDQETVSAGNFAPSIKENIDKLDNLSIFINGVQAKFSHDVFIVNNRIYLPVSDIENLNEPVTNRDLINKGINTKSIGGFSYISIQQLEKAYTLKSEWDFKNSTIKICNSGTKIKKHINNNSKIALIRLEDISPGGYYDDSETLKKLRIVSDFLSSRDVVFHIAWIPRHINPPAGYDCDPADKNSLYASEFIYTLDYLISNGGIVGLHGYTHQYGNSISGQGFEFFNSTDLSVPSGAEYAESRVKKAITAADILGIKYYFFEVPHYAISPNQMKEIEKYFQYIYQPNYIQHYLRENRQAFKNCNNVVFVPTPLDYYTSKNDILNRLNSIDDKTLASFFFHPTHELKYIKLKGDDEYEYSEDSPLHKVIYGFEQKGYKFNSILNLKTNTHK